MRVYREPLVAGLWFRGWEVVEISGLGKSLRRANGRRSQSPRPSKNEKALNRSRLTASNPAWDLVRLQNRAAYGFPSVIGSADGKKRRQ